MSKIETDRFRITPDDAIAVLNRIHQADPSVLPALIMWRVPCNDAVRDDPTVQVGLRSRASKLDDPDCEVGLLGILNGIFGIDPDTGYGPIAAYYDEDHTILRGFELTDFAKVAQRQANG